MRRADRLFELIQHLRGGRVLTARVLAERLEVSERTIYRDIRDLLASGVPIDGAAGVGYSMRKGYDLPPLMFTEEELEALVFGARIVRNWSDTDMARSADAAVGKIEAVVPTRLRRVIGDASLWSPANKQQAPLVFDLAQLRAAIRGRRKVRFRYCDEKGAQTHRTVHPLMLCFYGPFWVAGAWCELRNDFRFFQLDRMREVEFLEDTFETQQGRTALDLLRRELARP